MAAAARRRGTRAVMAVAGRPGDLPLELLARVCKDQGYLGVGEVLGRSDTETARGRRPLVDRLQQAMLHVGAVRGEMAWGFPCGRPNCDCHASRGRLEPLSQRPRATDALIGHLFARFALGGRRDCGRRPRCRWPRRHRRQTVARPSNWPRDPAYLADQFRAGGLRDVERGASLCCFQLRRRRAARLSCMPTTGRRGLGQSWADAALPAGAIGNDEYKQGRRHEPATCRCGQTPPVWTRSAACACGTSTGEPANRFDIMAGIASSADAFPANCDPQPAPAAHLEGLAQRRQIRYGLHPSRTRSQDVSTAWPKATHCRRASMPPRPRMLTFRFAERFRLRPLGPGRQSVGVVP